MTKARLQLVIALIVLLAPVARGQRTTAAGALDISAKVAASDAARRKETFEIVWQTVNDNHFDATFGGLEWKAVKDEFAPRVAKVQTDRELHGLLQEMLNRLGQSHFNIIPPESIPAVTPDDPAESATEGRSPAEVPLPRDGLEVAERMRHGLRVDVRVLNRSVVLTRVEAGSTAEAAGLRPGYVVRSVDGISMRGVLRMLDRNALYQPSSRYQIPVEILYGFFNGPLGTSAEVVYLDGANRVHRVTVKREKLSGEMSPPFQSLPPQFVEFESKRLARGIGYIRLNLFLLPVMEKFCQSLRSMSDAPGVVLDLRGNRGGLLGVVYGLSGLLEDRAVPLGTMRTRAGYMEFKVFPQKGAYRGQVVILIDNTSQSASEILTSGLKEWGRALVVGEKSSGSTLPAAAKELPTGAILQYAIADFWTPGGNRLEGVGVTPDIPIRLDRRALLSGRDPQLQAAIDAIQVSVTNRAIPVAKDSPEDVDVARPADVDPVAVDEAVDDILNKYVAAMGGREALSKISSRVSNGKIDGVYMGIKFGGNVEVFEKTPDRSVTITTMPDIGEVRRGFTGVYGYEQVPLFGFRKLDGFELSETRLGSALGLGGDLKRLFRKLTLNGQVSVRNAEAHLIEGTLVDGRVVRLYFDVSSGLMIRRDDTYFEDYREVDGVKVPFTVRDTYSVMTFSGVKHNIEVEDSRFAESKNCFNR